MSLNEQYEKLYRLQDALLSVVFAEDVGFYLTGGTCLHRFYERLETRLRSFPLGLLDDLAIKDEPLARRLKADYHSIIDLLLGE